MTYLSWFGRNARTGRTLLLSVTLLAGVALSGALVPASAQAAPAHSASGSLASHLVVVRHSLVPSAEAPNTPSCSTPPAGEFCIGTSYTFDSNGNPICTGSVGYIRTSEDHSAWFKFINVPGFNPECLINTSTTSSIWIENGLDQHPCVKPGEFAISDPHPFTIFFVRYNSACGNEPGNEPS
jgi:hypothetical protein